MNMTAMEVTAKQYYDRHPEIEESSKPVIDTLKKHNRDYCFKYENGVIYYSINPEIEKWIKCVSYSITGEWVALF